MTKRRLAAWFAAATLSIALLAGCSSGSAPEAHRGQKADENRDTVITDMQATYTWDVIHGSPESTPEETPAP